MSNYTLYSLTEAFILPHILYKMCACKWSFFHNILFVIGLINDMQLVLMFGVEVNEVLNTSFLWVGVLGFH